MKEKFSMKDAAFHKANISDLASRIKGSYPSFNEREFLNEVFSSLSDLELKERSALITQMLIKYLPDSFEEALTIILNSLPLENAENELTGYDGFIIMPLTSFVSCKGLDHFDLSTKALYEMTKRFTSEFDIRYFIQRYPQKMLNLLESWTEDESLHVRRLVSEGTRPRLPWAFQLKEYRKDPSKVLALLTFLKDDSELYVRRSVANNLNDISKDNPTAVIETLKSWQNGTSHMNWLTKHALRTLIKEGNSEALSLLGYKQSDSLDVKLTVTKKDLNLGESLELSAEIHSYEKESLPIMVDFIIWYKKANGTLMPKVFKLKKSSIKADENLVLNKKHKFADFSTRKHYSGEHHVALQINGKMYEKVTFSLK